MKEYICAGFGGQGILTTGFLLASIGVKAGKLVTWIPSYGSEMRGGTANCAIKISDEEIGSPYVKNCDVLLAMNGPAVERFEPAIKPGGCLIVNSSLAKASASRSDIRFVPVPANEIAANHGTPRDANLVMIGALAALQFYPKEVFQRGIEDYFQSKNLGKKDLTLFEEGYRLAESSK